MNPGFDDNQNDHMRYWIVLLLSAAFSLALASEAFGADVRLAQMVSTSCVDCHGPDEPKAKLNLASVVGEPIESHPEIWEKVDRRLRGRQMPPAGEARPTEAQYVAALSQLEASTTRQ